MDDRSERIQRRAHEIWEREGQPHGRHEDHWRQAETEIDAETGAGTGAGTDTGTAADAGHAPTGSGAGTTPAEDEEAQEAGTSEATRRAAEELSVAAGEPMPDETVAGASRGRPARARRKDAVPEP